MTGARAPVDVMIYVQHLLGTGHLQRAVAIARASAASGLTTALVSGGLPLAGLDPGGARLIQLDPVRARDESFTELVDDKGRAVGEPFKARRAAALLEIFEVLKPRVLMTEMFPFGRRQMRFELLPLLECAVVRPVGNPERPSIVCSLRDVLTTHKQPGKTDWMLETFARFYDFALVHGDPAILPLDMSFPSAGKIADRLRYTGYVLASPSPLVEPRNGTPGGGIPGGGTLRGGPPGGEVLVSTGGGAVAGPLIEAAMAARAISPLAETPWRILIGVNYPEAAFRAARARAPAGVIVERARPDFTGLLARARLSISQGGYNTTLEILAAKVPAVVVPFSARGETEQGLRARIMAGRGLMSVVEDDPLTPQALARGIVRALSRPPLGLADIESGGAAETVRILRATMERGVTVEPGGS